MTARDHLHWISFKLGYICRDFSKHLMFHNFNSKAVNKNPIPGIPHGQLPKPLEVEIQSS